MEKLNKYLKDNYKKVIGWGTGGYYHETSNKLNIDIDYLIDSDPAKVNTTLDGKTIMSSESLLNEKASEVLIIVFSSFYKEICETIEAYDNFYTISGEELLRFFSLQKLGEDEINQISDNSVITISRNNFALYLGGTSKFIREQMELLNKKNYTHVHLFWREYNIKNFQGTYFTIVLNGIELGFTAITNIFNLLKKIKAIFIHNLIGMKLEILLPILEAVKKRIPVIYYLHDFSSICSNIKLIYNDDEFCAGFDDNWGKCSTCKSGALKKDIYEFHQKLFHDEFIQLIAPSNSTKEIIQKSFNLPVEKIKVISHQNYSIESKLVTTVNPAIKIAYVGYKNKHKGWDTFKKLVLEFQGDYEFYCFGFSDEILEGVQHIDVSFIEDGELAMTNKLKEYNIDISFLWSVWPETYSYTYYESYAAGTYVITNNLSGNIHDQVMINGNGLSFENYEQLKMILMDKMKLKELIQNNNSIISGLRRNEEGILQLIQ